MLKRVTDCLSLCSGQRKEGQWNSVCADSVISDRMKWHLSLTESLWALQFWTPSLPLTQ